jgi:RNA polymerase sigma-70 factor (ECF subfamily)
MQPTPDLGVCAKSQKEAFPMRSNMSHAAPDRIVQEGVPAIDFHDSMIAALPSLRQQALALTRNRADADDLVQMAVTSALAAKASFEPGTNFRAWIGTILRNRFLSECRRRRPSVNVEDAPPAFLARSGGQEESLAMKELQRHLMRLPADQRLLLLMISVQGVSYEEASSQFGVPVGTLKARVSRTRTQLRSWILGETVERKEAAPLAMATERRALSGTSTLPGTRASRRDPSDAHRPRLV